MKSAFLFLLAITSFCGTTAHAMSKSIAKIQNELINESTVVTSFNLRAIDRSVLTFASAEVQTPSEKMKSFTAKLDKSGNYIWLNTQSNKAAVFKVIGNLEGIKEVRDLPKLEVMANHSGQNIGMRFRLTEIDKKEPNKKSGQESCRLEIELVDLENRVVAKGKVTEIAWDANSRRSDCQAL